MKKLPVILVVCFSAIIAISFVGCGSNSSRSECSCEICINDVPAYPSDSAASCHVFATDQDCGHVSFSTDSSETCGGEAQPVCTVSDCSGQCQCPGIDGDISAEFEEYEEE